MIVLLTLRDLGDVKGIAGIAMALIESLATVATLLQSNLILSIYPASVIEGCHVELFASFYVYYTVRWKSMALAL